MKKSSLLMAFLLMSLISFAQDEGDVVVKDRFERDKGLYLAVGPAITLGKNLGDYSNGFSFDVGFMKRSNKVFSWGPNVSILNFKYDETKTYKYYYDVTNDRALELAQTGGDVGLISVGLNLKLNFVPVGDNTKISVYGIANPFVSFVSRKEVSETVDIYEDDNGDGVYTDFLTDVDYTAEDYPALAAENKVSGGTHLGLGVEFNPAKALSFFGQVTFSYTLPVTYVATSTFLKDEDRYVDERNPPRVHYDASTSLFLDEFPIVEKSFSALSIKFGVSYNF